ncbi:uncharacterized protein Dana_GF26772 [Drosophila ananassae]|uniref:Uncharacterized protein n=1 Tax=Drosophila ananassae TaxID=7217 RepID=A0A0P9AXD0_DROAN|nr:uncharacterized protein Dana_GF26772 [Drosophila ananassae]
MVVLSPNGVIEPIPGTALDLETTPLWQQVSEELRREREMDELGQLFQQNLSLSPTVIGNP